MKVHCRQPQTLVVLNVIGLDNTAERLQTAVVAGGGKNGGDVDDRMQHCGREVAVFRSREIWTSSSSYAASPTFIDYPLQAVTCKNLTSFV